MQITVTITKQISAYTCILACLESILTDWGTPITQQELIDRFPEFCHKGKDIEGAFAFTKNNFDQVAKEFNFKWQQSNTFSISNNDDAYLIITTEGDKHCVRALIQKNNSSFWVMDPNANRFQSQPTLFEFDFEKEKNRKPILIKLIRAKALE